jgi:hypothetical protein
VSREVFVFGANTRGIHGKGAALAARREHGAIIGVGEGPQGSSYAIPTKDLYLRPRSLGEIKTSVETFIRYAVNHPEMTFRVTRIGCGLAGFKDHQIAPMFAKTPENCLLPDGWRRHE